jgi:hypothetical protein
VISVKRGRPSGVDVFMAAAADDEGLSPSHSHEVHPWGLGPPSGFVEVGRLANMVGLQAPRGLAELATPGQKPMDQLIAAGAGYDRTPVGENGRADSFERDPAETGDRSGGGSQPGVVDIAENAAEASDIRVS